MCRKILWCYVFILTLLDISLNTKLTAQGKSHGVTVQDTLIEGVTFEEWGKESSGQADGAEEEAERAGGVRLRPAALHFGRAALAAAHARAVTLINAANATLHLASVAGTTPDFHASFFEAKTLPPQGNTTFNVVYLGRREGPVSAHLYIHTSLGVHKYPVSAVGVASEYDVWPLVGVRVPANATVEPELTLYNPTDQTIQVSEVYSSGAWVGLRLPDADAAGRAPAALWAVPPRAARALVRLRLAPPLHHHHHPLTAYIRIKANIPGGGLVVAVEARGAAAGEHARPLQLRLRARGARDPPLTVAIEAGNSAEGAVRLEGALRGAACWAPPARAPPEPCAAPPPPARRLNGGGPTGAHIKLLRSQLDPYQDFTKVAELTLNYAELWAVAVASAGGAAGAVREAWCGGCVRLGRAALPYSVRLLPGSLLLVPDALHFVYAEREVALRTRELRAANEFEQPLRVDAILFPPDMFKYFQVEDLTPLSLKTGESTVLARIKLLESAITANVTLDSQVVLRTNLSEYTLPLLVYSGKFTFEWEWPQWNSTEIDLGTISADSTLTVPLRLRNAGPAPLCLTSVGARLAGAVASLELDPARLLAANGSAVCVEGGEWVAAQLRAGARGAGAWRGEAWALGPLARSARALRLRARPGRLAPRAIALPPAAPYCVSSAEVVVENSMAVAMDVVGVAVAEGAGAGVQWRGAASRLPPGAAALGAVSLAPERACRPLCYTGLDPASREGQSWVRRSAEPEAALGEDLALLAERLARFERQQAQINFTLLLRTTEVAATALRGGALLRWPRLAGARAGVAGAAAAGGARALRLLLRNPARAPLLLQPALPARRHLLPPLAGGDADEALCSHERCEWAPDAFSLAEWRVTRGRAAPFPLPAPASPPAHPGNASALPLLLLQPDSEIELKVVFAPQRAASFIAHLYLRNNLTIVEGVQLWGQGAVASFEIGGRRPGSTSPLLFEVSECGGAGGAEGGEGAGGAAVVRRAVTVRNTGRVAVRLRDWRVAGRACAARGFRLQPCAPLHLAPNDSRTLTLSYAADYTLARASASLRLRSERGIAEFTLAATTPAKLLSKCAGGARPPWEYSIRAGAWILSIATFVVVLVAGAVDAERMMRHLHASRAASPPRAPLDLRALAPPPAPPAPAPRAPPRRRRARPRPPPLDPQAERRAFERWRAEVLRRAEREDAAGDAGPALGDPDGSRPPEPRAASPSPPLDDFEPDPGAPRSSEDDSASSGSDASTPADERDETEVEPYEAENEATTREPSPVRPDDEPLREPANRPRFPLSTDAPPRAVRLRRERTESMRRSERARADSETSHSRSGPAMKHHLRRDKNSKRRAAPAAPARSSPGTIATDCNAEGGTNDADNGSTRGSVRWGASWSSVVGGAAAAPLAPIGSDVRRREPHATGNDNSLFYFNGDSPHVTASALSGDSGFTWGADRPAYVPTHDSYSTPNPDSPFGSGKLDTTFASKRDNGFGPAAPDCTYSAGSHDSTFVTGTHDSGFAPGTNDYLADKSAYGALGGVWGGAGGAGGAWWPAASAPLRPPPGFGREPARPFDPFRSLASIWAPGAVDWRPAAPSAAAPTAPAPSAPAAPRPPRPARSPDQ